MKVPGIPRASRYFATVLREMSTPFFAISSHIFWSESGARLSSLETSCKIMRHVRGIAFAAFPAKLLDKEALCRQYARAALYEFAADRPADRGFVDAHPLSHVSQRHGSEHRTGSQKVCALYFGNSFNTIEQGFLSLRHAFDEPLGRIQFVEQILFYAFIISVPKKIFIIAADFQARSI